MIECSEQFGAILVTYTDSEGTLRRLWFDETDEGRLVLAAEVADHPLDGADVSTSSHLGDSHRSESARCGEADKEDDPCDGVANFDTRYYLKNDEMSVPTRAREVLSDRGYEAETIYDVRGREI